MVLKCLEVLEEEGTELSQYQAVAIMNAVIVTKKITEFYYPKG